MFALFLPACKTSEENYRRSYESAVAMRQQSEAQADSVAATIHNVILASNKPHPLEVAGFTVMMAFQTFLIMGGVIKLIPLTGVTLPFISYGGTSIFVSILVVSFIQWVNGYEVKAERNEVKAYEEQPKKH